MPGFEPTPFDCFGTKVRGLHHCATTPVPQFIKQKREKIQRKEPNDVEYFDEKLNKRIF